MKTKLLLTVLFSIGIIGITSAQGFAKNDRMGGPRQTEMVKVQHGPVQDHKISRHKKRKIHRMAKKHHRHVVVRHKKHF